MSLVSSHRAALLMPGDFYKGLADLRSFLDADRRQVELYAQQKDWTRKGILNVASSDKFSSDRTIGEYARVLPQRPRTKAGRPKRTGSSLPQGFCNLPFAVQFLGTTTQEVRSGNDVLETLAHWQRARICDARPALLLLRNRLVQDCWSIDNRSGRLFG